MSIKDVKGHYNVDKMMYNIRFHQPSACIVNLKTQTYTLSIATTDVCKQ